MAELHDMTSDFQFSPKSTGTGSDILSGIRNTLFSDTQIGSLTKFVEPVSGQKPLEEVVWLFRKYPELKVLPVEEHDRVVGTIERRYVETCGIGRLGRLFSGECIKYVKRTTLVIHSRDYIRAVHEKVIEEYKKNGTLYYPVFERNHTFFGVFSLEELMGRIRRLREQELDLAQEVQFHLFPSDEELKALPFGVSVWNRMVEKVGGDFCTVKRIGDSGYIIAVFDVSGKNLAAAMLTVAIGSFFSMFRLLFQERIFSPVKLTSVLDDYLGSIVPAGSFVTATLCYVDLAKPEIIVHNCGHTMLYMVFPSGRKKELEVLPFPATFPPLGMSEISRLTKSGAVPDALQIAFPIGKGLHIDLFSDGFTDMLTTQGDRFEAARARDFFTGLYWHDQNDVGSLVEQTVTGWAGSTPLPDDITVMDIRFS